MPSETELQPGTDMSQFNFRECAMDVNWSLTKKKKKNLARRKGGQVCTYHNKANELIIALCNKAGLETISEPILKFEEWVGV